MEPEPKKERRILVERPVPFESCFHRVNARNQRILEQQQKNAAAYERAHFLLEKSLMWNHYFRKQHGEPLYLPDHICRGDYRWFQSSEVRDLPNSPCYAIRYIPIGRVKEPLANKSKRNKDFIIVFTQTS